MAWVKRLFDITVASSALIAAAPVLAGVAFLVRKNLGAPVMFRQRRPGRDGRPFEMFKFRTMLDAVGPDGVALPDQQRLTPFGAWLRASSLDELPELWNVVRGDMSLVGPRPLLMHYLPLYSARQTRRHAVRPGITGWAQVNGRNSIDWPAKFELDVWYVEHQSLRLDAQILWKTVRAVLLREGISAAGQATMQPFTGTPST